MTLIAAESYDRKTLCCSSGIKPSHDKHGGGPHQRSKLIKFLRALFPISRRTTDSFAFFQSLVNCSFLKLQFLLPNMSFSEEARVDGAKCPTFKGDTRSKGEAWDESGVESGEGLGDIAQSGALLNYNSIII